MMNQQLSVTNVNSTGGASNDSCGGHGHGSVSSSSQFQENGSGGGQKSERKWWLWDYIRNKFLKNKVI